MCTNCFDHIEYIKNHTIDPGLQPKLDIFCSPQAYAVTRN